MVTTVFKSWRMKSDNKSETRKHIPTAKNDAN
jgi:hypothetical protein